MAGLLPFCREAAEWRSEGECDLTGSQIHGAFDKGLIKPIYAGFAEEEDRLWRRVCRFRRDDVLLQSKRVYVHGPCQHRFRVEGSHEG